MPIQDYRVPTKVIPSGSQFAERNLRQKRSNRVAYWRLNPAPGDGSDVVEELVQTAANCSGTPASIVWDRDNRSPANLLAPEFDGSSSTIDLYSAQLDSAISKTEATISVWAKVANSGVWSDSTKRVILHLGADGDNYFEISRTTTNDQVRAEYKAGGTSKTVDISTLVSGESPVQWVHYCMVVSVVGDTLDFYVNGTAGTQATSLGTWAGSLNSDLTVVGSSALGTPADVWSGYIAELGIWSTPLSAAEVYNLANIV